MSRPGFRHVAAIAAALVALTWSAFSGVVSNGFVNYDDDVYVTENPHVLAGLNGAGVAWALTSTEAANWHPLTWMSHMLDVTLFGRDAGRHHLVSLLIHTVNVVLLFLLLSRMTGATWQPAFVAALFAIHPLHVESVAWIAERKDVLSTLFWLLTTWAWLSWIDAKTAARYALVLVLFAAGLMAKPMLVTLPFTLMLFDYWPLERAALPPLWREKIPLFAMSAASCGVTFMAQRAGGAVQSLDNFPLGERLANASVAYASYLGRTIWPVSLAVFYPYPHGGLPVLAAVGAAALLAAVTAVAARLARPAPYVLVGWLWYLGTLVPVIGLVQIGSQSMADRYTYVPLIGIFIAVTWGLADVARRARVAPYAAAAGAMVLALLVVAARAQTGYWVDSATLFTHALDVTPDNWLAHGNLGGALADQGHLEQAAAHAREALRIRPAYTEAHYNLGLALARSGRNAEAIGELERALTLRPGYAKAHNNLAGILASEGRAEEAIVHLHEAIRLDPANAEARYNLAGLLLDAGRLPEAVASYEAAARLQPNDSEIRAALDHAREAARLRQ